MTTIVGLVQEGVICLAADSLASGDGTAITLRRPKIVRKMTTEAYAWPKLIKRLEEMIRQRRSSLPDVEEQTNGNR